VSFLGLGDDNTSPIVFYDLVTLKLMLHHF